MWTKAIVVLALCVDVFAQTDGPATLPLTTPTTSFVSANSVKVVPATGLQAALTSAVCGDSISVQPGDYVGGLVLPSGCDAQHAITVVGQPGARILECGAQHISGGAFVVLGGLEITRPNGCVGVTYNFFASLGHDLILSNLNVHGDPLTETVRGVQLGGSKNVAILNSTFTDFHCLAVTGACLDAQGIAFGIGDQPDSGNYLIQGNYIEAAAENILGGGGGDLYTPCDITITGNTLVKPRTWNPASPSYLGKAWIVKNLFELKNGCRVLFEKNTLSGNWGGYSQAGFAILLTPKNQNGQCAVCKVTDVTIRNTSIEYSGAAFQLATGASDSGAVASDGGRWSIHDISIHHTPYAGCFGCSANQLIQLTSSPTPVLHDVWLYHISAPSDGETTVNYHGFLLLGGPLAGAGQAINIRLTNSLFSQGTWPMAFSGGGATNCAYGIIFTNYAATLSSCWGGASAFTGNVILTTGEPHSGSAPSSTWPSGNILINVGANPYSLP